MKKNLLAMLAALLMISIANAATGILIKGKINTNISMQLQEKDPTTYHVNSAFSKKLPQWLIKGTSSWEAKYQKKIAGEFMAGQFIYRVNSFGSKINGQGCVIAYKFGLDGENHAWAHSMDSEKSNCTLTYTYSPDNKGNWVANISINANIKQ